MAKRIISISLFLIICGSLIFAFFLKKKISFNEREIVKENHVLEKNETDVLVTFIELGSVKCVPCKMMQPVMDEIEKKYGDQVKVIFYDVWTSKGRPYGTKYGIKAIPTQVFLDKNGEEFFRHQGYFSEEEIVKVLKMQGVQIND